MTKSQKSALARALNALRKTHAGGRPRTVPHSPAGPCRCSDCRKKRQPKPQRVGSD